MSSVTSSLKNNDIASIGILIVGILLVGFGAYMIVTHLVGLVEGAAGLLFIFVGLLLIDYASKRSST